MAAEYGATARRLGIGSASLVAAMLLSGGLALAGLSGVVTGNMALRNIGIAGYGGAFFVVVLLLGVLFHRRAVTEPGSVRPPDSPAAPSAAPDR